MSGDAGAHGFTNLGEDEIYRGYAIRVVNASLLGPGGEPFRRDIVRAPGAVAVVPVLDGPEGAEVVAVRQYRPALDQLLLEIPAGLRDKPGEPPEETARRELVEEAGFEAERLELLTVFANAAGMTDQRTYVYLAQGLRPVPSATDGVEEAYLTVERVRLADVEDLIARGDVVDAKTIIGLLLARARLSD